MQLESSPEAGFGEDTELLVKKTSKRCSNMQPKTIRRNFSRFLEVV